MANLASLIVTVYNKPEHLRCILEACRRQTVTAFELIVADDGSGPGVAAVIGEYTDASPFPVSHVWHEDAGWRKNSILNAAIRTSTTPYVIFIDGDCIPHRRFVQDHLQERRHRVVTGGRRVETSARWTEQLTPERVRTGAFERIGLGEITESLAGKSRHIENGVWLRSRLLRAALHPHPRGICGYNFSLWKRDLEEINGFDECYTTPGVGEDVDVEYRLGLIGVQARVLHNRAIVFHLHHPKTHIPDASVRRYDLVREQAHAWCEFGLRQAEVDARSGPAKIPAPPAASL
jgi:glycosyltransferase involved in cell wall biosynthesis